MTTYDAEVGYDSQTFYTNCTLSGLRSGLATNLARISGLRVSATIPDDPKPPIAIVVPSGITYDTAFARGADTYDFTILVIVGRVSERTAQTLMDGYCNPSGSTSVKAAVEYDTSLGGQCYDLRVTEMRNYQSLAIGEITYLAAEFVVQVIAE